MSRYGSWVSVVAVLVLAGSAALVACGRDEGTPTAEFAIYAEHSLSNKPMVRGWNTRVFNKREVQEGQSISLDDQTGVVTLKAGRYHITAMSLVNYYDPANPTVIPNSSTPAAGYARLRYLQDALPPDTVPTVDVIDASNAKALSVGTGSDANALPSFMETFVEVDDQAQLVVEHQIGDDVKDVFLQVNSNGSSWHINARISIRRI